MDPMSALISILCGHEVADHADALRGWLASGGFEPVVISPADISESFAWHLEAQYGNHDPREFKANRAGIWSRDEVRDDWWLAASWSQVEKLEDCADY